MIEQRQRNSQHLRVKRYPEVIAPALTTTTSTHFSRGNIQARKSAQDSPLTKHASWIKQQKTRPHHYGQRCSFISHAPSRYFLPRSVRDMLSYPSANPVQKLTTRHEASSMLKLICEGERSIPHQSLALAANREYVSAFRAISVSAQKQARKVRPWQRSMYFFQPSLGSLLKSSRNSVIRSSRPQIQQRQFNTMPRVTPRTTWFRLCAPRYILEVATSATTTVTPSSALTLGSQGKYLRSSRKRRTVMNQLCPEGFPNSAGQQRARLWMCSTLQKGRGSTQSTFSRVMRQMFSSMNMVTLKACFRFASPTRIPRTTTATTPGSDAIVTNWKNSLPISEWSACICRMRSSPRAQSASRMQQLAAKMRAVVARMT